jgi:hypothetical protein
LQLSGVDGSGHHAVLELRRGRSPTRPETGGDLLERVARGDLRLAAPVHEPSSAGLHRRARGGALGAQSLEPGCVDRLERQRGLKSLAGRRVEIARGPERSLPIELRAVALEAQGSGRPRTPCCPGEPTIEGRPVQSLAAGRTQCSRAFAFELTARETNPFMLGNLRSFDR